MSWACDAPTVSAMLDTYRAHGALFASTLQTLLAAQCALLTPEQWPRDRTDSVLQDNKFDFVVVGTGAAGAVVANRLSEVSDWKVLLVEAGGDPNMATELPPLLFSTLKTSVDWAYTTEAQGKACLGVVDGRCYWPRGKVLGGCTSINAMFYVRGNRKDYDEWEEAGNHGWSYKDVLPYFKKSQNIEGGHINEEDLAKYHGKGGYLQTEINGDDDILEEAILKANEEAGSKISYDINGQSQMGVTRGFSTTRDARRLSTARAFLSPIKDRTNLYVMKDSIATKILFEDDSNVVKGLVIHKDSEDIIVNVKKEVIISGGAVNSPQLLLLSGIGPKEDLTRLDIEVKKDLPVGMNLEDHVFVPMFYTMKDKGITLGDQAQYILDYLTKREGPLTSMKHSRIVNFINTVDSTSEVPDIEQHFVIYPANISDSIEYHEKHNFGAEVRSLFKELNKHKLVIMVYNVLLRPLSKGWLKLRSADPLDHPLIYANYFDNPQDLDTLVAGMRHAMSLENTDTFKKLGINLEWIDLESCRGLDRKSDEFLKCWGRQMTTTLYHPTGTTKMGPTSDPEAVVDSELRVYGIQGLRVIDTSVMPSIVRGNTMAPAIMIGEKGSDMIKAKWAVSKDEL